MIPLPRWSSAANPCIPTMAASNPFLQSPVLQHHHNNRLSHSLLLRSKSHRPRAATTTVRMHASSAPEHSPPPRRFAVLKTGDATEYTERAHGGYGRMMERLLRDGDERWDVFPVLEGDFSFLRDLEAYDGFVITGSAADAHSPDVDWILRLCDALALLHARRKRILGVCFGHQVLARALGGETGRADVGWELGIKRLSLDAGALFRLNGFELQSPIVDAIESHRDQVSSVPPGAVVLASSEKTKIEMFALGQHVLGMQCHPEFSKDVVTDIIERRLSANVISAEVASEALASLKDREADHEALRQLCKAFLKKAC